MESPKQQIKKGGVNVEGKKEKKRQMQMRKRWRSVQEKTEMKYLTKNPRDIVKTNPCFFYSFFFFFFGQNFSSTGSVGLSIINILFFFFCFFVL